MTAGPDHPFHDGSSSLPPSFWRFVDVEERLIEAMTVLIRSADREASWIGGGGSSLWRMVQDDLDTPPDTTKPIVTCAFTRQQQDRATEALEWIAKWVPTGPTRKVLARGLTQHVLDEPARLDWSEIWLRMGGKASGWTADALRMRYGRAITMICNRLNR
ncbi:hypothetical protein HY78_14565 [Rhizorhabdus wittichii DC-6]|nr:hypothetical protein HY78_14565 [Rhizorhabdus wittichii DC-6]